MTTASPHSPIERADLLQAVAFAQVWFDRWLKSGLIRADQHRAVLDYYADWRGRLEDGAAIPANVHLRGPDVCWSCKERVDPSSKACPTCGAPARGGDVTALRYLDFLCLEVRKHQDSRRLGLAAGDDCLADANARIRALRAKLDRERIPLGEAPARAARLADVLHETSPAEEPVLDVIPVDRPRRRPPPPLPTPRRSLMEILLDPRSIQWLLACGGALLVLGLIIWLGAEGLFQDPLFVAGLLGAGTLALLLAGWAVIAYTRHQIAGRALTLLACLLMPFNLWFYDFQGLISVREGGHLWIPALICCALYAVSARLLRDPTFVYVFVLGVAGTGLLILADRGMKFWEVAAPSSLLIGLALASIHAERFFPEGEGPFTRRRFGLAFFWSGHVLLGAGLLLLLGAHVFGDWMFSYFEAAYRQAGVVQPEIVLAPWGKMLSLALVLAGTYAYAYSDLVVRKVGVYFFFAVVTLLWAEVLVIRLFDWPVRPIEVVIMVLALTGLLANLGLGATAPHSSLRRAGPSLALVLCTLPVVLGVLLHWQASLMSMIGQENPLKWGYVAAMLLTAVSCRVGAFVSRRESPSLSLTYFFGAGAATMLGAAGLLLVLYPERGGWEFQAPILMLIPLLYLVASRLYRGHTPSRPLAWVAHAGTVVLLVTSIGATFRGFLLTSGDSLNLALAVFFAEAALFYGLDAAWRKTGGAVYACTAAASAAVWQLLLYAQVDNELYILTFAVVGLALLIGYRMAVLDKVRVAGLALAAFQSANALLSLAFVGGALLTLSNLGDGRQLWELLRLSAALSVIALVALYLVRHEGWRRWYLAMSITHAVLAVLVLASLSDLTPAERLEVVSIVAGLILLGVGHVGWFREQEDHSDMVSASLIFGSLLVAVPLTLAVLTCRIKSFDTAYKVDTFHTLNEVGMLVAGLVLLASGVACQIKSTTLAGGFMMAIWLVTLLLYVRVPHIAQTAAVYIMVGGGLFFGVGLLLSLYRDRLLHLPERIKRREGVFKVLTWR